MKWLMVPLDESLFDVWHDVGLIDWSEHGDLVKVLIVQVLPKSRERARLLFLGPPQ